MYVICLLKKKIENYYGERREDNNDYYRMINRTARKCRQFLVKSDKSASLYFYILINKILYALVENNIE